MWEAILVIASKLLGFTLDRIQDNKEMKEAFLKFVEARAAHSNAVQSHDSFEEQRKELTAPPEPPKG
jgi:hypothetical protein